MYVLVTTDSVRRYRRAESAIRAATRLQATTWQVVAMAVGLPPTVVASGTRPALPAGPRIIKPARDRGLGLQ